MKTPEEQIFNFIDKQIEKHKEKYLIGKSNYFLEWSNLKEEFLCKDEIITDLNFTISKYRNILQYIKEHFNINIDENRF